jgi:glutamate-1-semialdehyde 2,1-aminomutase
MDTFSSAPGQPVFFAGTYNGHPGMVAAARACLRKLEEEPVHEHVFALGQRARDGLVGVFADAGVQVTVAGYGSVFVSYVMEGPQPETYADLLRNDAATFVGYRRELMKHGVFELPLNLKRSHVSYAHTDAHIDQLLSGVAASLAPAVAATSSIDLAAASTMGGAVASGPEEVRS